MVNTCLFGENSEYLPKCGDCFAQIYFCFNNWCLVDFVTGLLLGVCCLLYIGEYVKLLTWVAVLGSCLNFQYIFFRKEINLNSFLG